MPAAALSLLLALAPSVARAADDNTQSITYELSIGGTKVGTRELTITWLPMEPGLLEQPRIITTYTKLDAAAVGLTYAYEHRASAHMRGSRTSMTSSINENGAVREVQARRGSDGRWDVTVVDEGQVRRAELRPSEVGLTSLDLLDPDHHKWFTRSTHVKLLAAETGTVFAGPVETLSEGSERIGGRDVRVERFGWTPENGRVELAWSEDGQLVSYSTQLGGKQLLAQATSLPEPRTFGTIEAAPQARPIVVDEEEL